NKRDESLLQTHVSCPEPFVRNSRDRFTPILRIAKCRFPVLTNILLEQVTQQQRDPGRGMNSIRDVTDRDLFDFPFGPEFLPERARNFSMLATHAIGRTTHPNRQRRQTVTLTLARRLNSSETEKLIFA